MPRPAPLVLVLLAAAGVASAQTAPESGPAEAVRPAERVWYGGGAGLTVVGVGAVSHLTYTRGRHAVSLRSAVSADLVAALTCATGTSETSPCPVVVLDLGVVYARPLVDAGGTWVSVGAGLGGAATLAEDGPGGFAIPPEVQARQRLTSWLGVGLYGFGSVNGQRSFVGGAFEVVVGDLR